MAKPDFICNLHDSIKLFWEYLEFVEWLGGSTIVQSCVYEGSKAKDWPSDIIVKVCLPYYKHANLVRHLGGYSGKILDYFWSGEVMRKWISVPCHKLHSHTHLTLQLALSRLAQMCDTEHLFPEVLSIGKTP